MIKGRINDFPLHSFFLLQQIQLFLNTGVKINSCFDFHIDLQPQRLQEIIDLSQRRNAGVRIFRVGFVKHKFLKLLQRIIPHIAVPVAHTVYRFIMDYHQLAILTQLYVQLHAVRPLLRSQTEGLQCIFRRICAGSPVCPYF